MNSMWRRRLPALTAQMRRAPGAPAAVPATSSAGGTRSSTRQAGGSGARAGDVTDVLEDSPLYHVRRGSIFSATLPIVAKYREQRRKGSSDMA